MKKTYLLFILFAGLLFTACNDEFLDRTPEDKVSDRNLWKTANHLKLYVNNFYNSNRLLPRYADYGVIGNYTLDRDNGSDTQIYSNYNTRMNGEMVIPETGGGWGITDWEPLRNINYFFAHYQTAAGNEADINQYVGEALFFRAIFYYNMLRQFGNVPFYKNLMDISHKEELYKARDPRNVVVDSLMKDLDKAVGYLPSRSHGWSGRVNKETAMLLQARIALYEGTWEKYHAGTKFGVTGADGKALIEKAAQVTDALMAMKTCSLDNVGESYGYYNLFKSEDFSNSKEVLFWRKYSLTDNLTHYWGRYSCNGAASGLTKSMIDSYLCTDGKPIAGNPLYLGDDSLLKVVANRDPRLRQTIYVNDGEHYRFKGSVNTLFEYPSFTGPTEERCITGYQLYKGHNPDLSQYNNSRSITALIYFRYAEALLINAEAKAELGTITQTDVDNTINALRLRVGMNNGLLQLNNIASDPNWEFPALSPIINEVRRERKVELAAEGFRVDDIFRWAAADKLIKGKKPLGAKRAQWETVKSDFIGDITNNIKVNADGYIDPYANYSAVANGYNFNPERDYLKPIPTTELILNPKLAPNNPGW